MTRSDIRFRLERSVLSLCRKLKYSKKLGPLLTDGSESEVKENVNTTLTEKELLELKANLYLNIVARVALLPSIEVSLITEKKFSRANSLLEIRQSWPKVRTGWQIVVFF